MNGWLTKCLNGVLGSCEASETVGKLKLWAGEHQTQTVEQDRTTTSGRRTVGSPTPYSRRHRFLERTFHKSRPGTAHRARSHGHAHERVTSLLGLGVVIGGNKKALLSRRRFTTDWSKLDIYFRHLKKKLNSGMGSAPAAFSTLKTGWRIAHILEASLGYIASLCLKTITTNPNNKKS